MLVDLMTRGYHRISTSVDVMWVTPTRAWQDGAVAEDELVRVFSTPSIPEGEIARARLEDEGIPVLVKGEGGGPYRVGPVMLFVPAHLEVQAHLILETIGDPLSADELKELDELAEGSAGPD
jgi:hypothetical protein